MDIDLPSNHRQPPAMALAVATIVAAGVTGLAVAGLTWTLDRPAGHSTSAPPPDMAAFDPTPSATASIDTPGWAEALGLPPPAPVAPVAPATIEGAGAVARAAPANPEEAATRRPKVGPTASTVRSTPTAASATAAAATGASAPAASAAPALDDPAADPVADDSVLGTDPVPDPALDAVEDPAPTETSAPDDNRRRWDPPRRTWRDEPRQAPAQQWGGPFGNFPFAW